MRGTYKQGKTQFLSKFGAGDLVQHGPKVLRLERVFFHPGKDSAPPYFSYAAKGADGLFIKVREVDLARLPKTEPGQKTPLAPVINAERARIKKGKPWIAALPALVVLLFYAGVILLTKLFSY